MGPTGCDYRVLQIHPTRRCNLKCLHCYSSSGPEEVQELPLDLLRQALMDARSEGYNVLGVSGGEPLMYRSLGALLHHARSLGLITTITTNGLLLTERRLEELREVVDLIAISIDGVPDSHDQMRGAAGSFETIEQRLRCVRQSGISFGLIFTLTLHNLHELKSVARFAVDQGARLLQVHPLEAVGRAEETLPNSAPDDLELAYAFIEVARIQRLYEGKIKVQFDVVDRELIRLNPERVFAVELDDQPDLTCFPLAEMVAPLIIDQEGFIVPIQYGFSRAYTIGNLHQGPLLRHAARWKSQHYLAFLDLCRKVFDKLTDPGRSKLPFTNWYSAVMTSSHSVVPSH